MTRLGMGLAMAAALAAGSARADVVESAQIGTWALTANYTDGSFGNCSIASDYGTRARVTFMVTNRGVFGVGVQNLDWNLNTGARTQASYRVDGGPIRRQVATAAGPKLFLMLLDASSASVIQELRLGQKMFLGFGSSTYTLTLNGTKSALAGLAECYTKHR